MVHLGRSHTQLRNVEHMAPDTIPIGPPRTILSTRPLQARLGQAEGQIAIPTLGTLRDEWPIPGKARRARSTCIVVPTLLEERLRALRYHALATRCALHVGQQRDPRGQRRGIRAGIDRGGRSFGIFVALHLTAGIARDGRIFGTLVSPCIELTGEPRAPGTRKEERDAEARQRLLDPHGATSLPASSARRQCIFVTCPNRLLTPVLATAGSRPRCDGTTSVPSRLENASCSRRSTTRYPSTFTRGVGPTPRRSPNRTSTCRKRAPSPATPPRRPTPDTWRAAVASGRSPSLPFPPLTRPRSRPPTEGDAVHRRRPSPSGSTIQSPGSPAPCRSHVRRPPARAECPVLS